MKSGRPLVLTINGGSSSIRFAIHGSGQTPRHMLSGKIDRIGSRGTTLTVHDPKQTTPKPRRLPAADHKAAVGFLFNWLEAQPVFGSVKAVGHRVGHGMRHSEPERVTSKLLAELRRITPYDPDHLPREIALMETIRARHPKLPQVACFDTAFHGTMPRVARLLPIPRRYAAQGVERYGFHGLSYAYLMEELGRIDPAAPKGRVILAHLGNGASFSRSRPGPKAQREIRGGDLQTRRAGHGPGYAHERRTYDRALRVPRASSRKFGREPAPETGPAAPSIDAKTMKPNTLTTPGQNFIYVHLNRVIGKYFHPTSTGDSWAGGPEKQISISSFRSVSCASGGKGAAS